MMLQRTAKSCRSDAPGLASSLREEAQATVATKPGHREEREVSRKTIARGMPGDFRCTCGDYTRVLSTLHTRLRVHWAPAFPAPSDIQSGETILQNLGRSAREIAEAYLDLPSLRGAPATKQSILTSWRDGLLRLRSQ